MSLPGSVLTHVPLGTVAWDRETLLTSYSSVWLLERGHGISLTQTHGLRVAGQIGYLEEAGILLYGKRKGMNSRNLQKARLPNSGKSV